MNGDSPNRVTMNKYAGERLKQMREELGFSQSELAALLSIDHDASIDFGTISRWERGKNTVPAWAIQYVELLKHEAFSINKEVNLKESSEEVKLGLASTVLRKVRSWLKG